MSAKVIERSAGKIDITLPKQQWMKRVIEMAGEFPLEIVEDGITYQVFDCQIRPAELPTMTSVGDPVVEAIIFYQQVPEAGGDES